MENRDCLLRAKREGFTLVELLIAIAVFSVIATFALGSVVSILNAGRKARSLSSVMTNLDSTVEVMSRELKFGTHFHCVMPSETLVFPPPPQNCSGNPNAAQPEMTFVTSDGIDTAYRLHGTTIQKSTDDGVTWIAVTAPEVVVQSMKYYVLGSYPQSDPNADNAQPKVIIVIRGYAGTKPSLQSNFVLQTMVSQRVLDLTSDSGSGSGGSGGGGGGSVNLVPALVQQKKVTKGSSGSTLSLTLDSAPAAGDTLILSFGSGGTPKVSSVTTNGSGTWIKAVANSSSGGELWYLQNTDGSDTSFLVTDTAGGTAGVSVSEWSGLESTGSLVDDINTGSGSATASVTPTAGSSILIIAEVGSTSKTPNSGPTDGFTAIGAYNYPMSEGYLIVPSSSGSYSTSWGYASGGGSGNSIAAFRGGSVPSGD